MLRATIVALTLAALSGVASAQTAPTADGTTIPPATSITVSVGTFTVQSGQILLNGVSAASASYVSTELRQVGDSVYGKFQGSVYVWKYVGGANPWSPTNASTYPVATTPTVPSVPDGLPSTAFTLKINGTDHAVTISGSSMRDFAWQFGQYWRSAEGMQAASQASGAVCLTSPEVAAAAATTWNRVPPIPNANFDWTISRITDPRDQSILSVVPTTGAVYRNGIRLGNAVVQKLCVYGDIYAKGKTSGTWSRWDSTTKTWIVVPADRDATVLD